MAQPNQLQQQSMEPRVMDHDEKKMRRQIANSNERRRMQSINAGFQSLRQLLPHHEGEKLSKVSHKVHFIVKPRSVLGQFLFEIATNEKRKRTNPAKLASDNKSLQCCRSSSNQFAIPLHSISN